MILFKEIHHHFFIQTIATRQNSGLPRAADDRRSFRTYGVKPKTKPRFLYFLNRNSPHDARYMHKARATRPLTLPKMIIYLTFLVAIYKL